MTESIGSLIDRLVIVNIKGFMVQDLVHKARAAKKGLDAETTEKLVSLNVERNKLITAIDRSLADAVSSGRAEIDERTKIL